MQTVRSMRLAAASVRRLCEVLEERGPMRLRRLAVAASMSAGYASKRLRRLEEDGYVARVPEHAGQTGGWPWLYARTGKPLPESSEARGAFDPGPVIDAMCRHA